MNTPIRYAVLAILLAVASPSMSYGSGAVRSDTLSVGPVFVHGIGAEYRPEYIFKTHEFLQGYNAAGRPLDLAHSAHLRYRLSFAAGSQPDRTYGGVYQGIGAAYCTFGNRRELGDPKVVYLYQGGRIARLSPRLSFDYEWNLGLSFGWNPYDATSNNYQRVIGSRMNAYINADFYLDCALSRRVSLAAGLSATHFSNGNTEVPNAGLNTVGLKLGLNYDFGEARRAPDGDIGRGGLRPFPRHFSYDAVLFGSWRRKAVASGGTYFALPDAYTVLGVNVAAMYNFGYKFRAGVSVDGVWDNSANVTYEDVICELDGVCYDDGLRRSSFGEQIALGVSARAEFVMPFFTVGVGLGANVLHHGGDLRSFYQILTLKIAVTRSSFLHIGYNLKDFHMPNYLMLGVGYRFNNKYPKVR